MKFTQIPATLKYPPLIRSKLSTYHSNIISWALEHYSGTFQERLNIVNALNAATYFLMSGNSFPADWNTEDPMINLPEIDSDECRSVIHNLYIDDRKLNWDIEKTTDVDRVVPSAQHSTQTSLTFQSKKEDLYIQAPEIPLFNKSEPIIVDSSSEDTFVIYPSLPKIPTKQNEISITTDVSIMTDKDLLRLFPDHFIPTRAECMYTQYEGLDYHPVLGTIFPISTFTYDQIVENIIKYPHLYKLRKQYKDKNINFYKTIEIDGELFSIVSVWNSLPECKHTPNIVEFLKEYVVRRYLLERDILGVEHKYKIDGELLPYLTLFTSVEEYKSWGYTDSIELARKCVNSRVTYKRSRSPILRRN